VEVTGVPVASLTPLALSALALLVERPMHPYEMYRLMIERSEQEVVKVRPGTLYHAMARMADAELVEAVGTDREGGRPERTTYRITPAGCRAMQERLRGLLAHPVEEYPSFPVALGEAHNLPRAEVVELLRERIRALGTKLDRSKALVARAAEKVDEAYLVDRHYLAEMATAELGFLQRLVVRIENEELEWPSRP
jgi:DNA-binding PadR family transcriptional regulator